MFAMKSSKFDTGWGRGPTRFMSPRMTLKNCGSSSSRNFLSHFPTRVMRLALSHTHSDVGASARCMVRNLINLKRFAAMPTRS